MFLNGKNTDVFQKDLIIRSKHAKHPKLSRCSRVGAFLACLFVSASDELIGAETDWLLLREGGNFSVTLWLIIALKYVTVPTPSEVFDRRLWCVFTQAGRQLSGTHSSWSYTSACDCCRHLYIVNCQKKIVFFCRWIKIKSVLCYHHFQSAGWQI